MHRAGIQDCLTATGAYVWFGPFKDIYRIFHKAEQCWDPMAAFGSWNIGSFSNGHRHLQLSCCFFTRGKRRLLKQKGVPTSYLEWLQCNAGTQRELGPSSSKLLRTFSAGGFQLHLATGFFKTRMLQTNGLQIHLNHGSVWFFARAIVTIWVCLKIG